jgi:DNA-binding MarR family transcriptional regulator
VSAPNDLGYLLQQAAKQYRTQFAIELRPHNLTTQQAAVLLALATSPGRALAPSSVAELIGADPATTTGLLQRLERDGWLVSATNPEDGRSRLLSLTPTAQLAVPSLREVAEGVSARAANALSGDELATLVALLGRLVDHESVSRGEAKG